MEIGHLHQKANPVVVSFVFGCAFVTLVFLFFLRSVDTIVGNEISVSIYEKTQSKY